MNARPFLWAALFFGATYLVSNYLVLPEWGYIAWKGMGVGLLANWASRQGRSTDHRLLAAVLILGALADMVLEIHFVLGAAIFAFGHVVAITLYLRNKRADAGKKDAVLGTTFTAGSMALAYALASSDWALPVAVYTLFLGAMAACALASRFRLASVGALLFLLSDLVIFARMGVLAHQYWADVVIWALYFSGQALIAVGVCRALNEPQAAK